MQKSVAEQLLDYRLQHGEANVTVGKFESMKIAAEIEQAQSKSITAKLDKALTPGFNDNNTSDVEQSEALSEGKNLVIHNLRIAVASLRYNLHIQDDYTEVNHYNNSNKSYYNGSITKTINQIRNFQKGLDRQHLEEMQQEKMQQSRGISMGM
ncbi:hypothetical protein [Candidatus Tisiphia endosymbiont of Hybos culiciformis]|uniref:hypothetical protein n=1 Tax=Candidatus Tisiphia endosymbiont of Hybos culiciformis TaxID=3139331 RepID=UPI003CCB6F7A